MRRCGRLPGAAAVVECADGVGDGQSDCLIACFGGETCPTGMRCVADLGLCMWGPPYADCAAGEPCASGGFCLAEGQIGICLPPCQETADCPATPRCTEVNGNPGCLISCGDDVACPRGMFCIEGVTCVWAPRRSYGDCLTGELCPLDAVCLTAETDPIQGACAPQGCSGATDCPVASVADQFGAPGRQRVARV